MRITMLVVSPHNQGLLEYPLLAADLHRPYRLEQWADGISDAPHGHNTDGLEAALDLPPFHLVGPFHIIALWALPFRLPIPSAGAPQVA